MPIVSLLLSTSVISFNLKENFLLFLIGLELMILAINLEFIYNGILTNDASKWFNALILLSVAAVDTAIGLALLIRYSNVRSEKVDSLKLSATADKAMKIS
jgi:NADH-quinone oxidoreductase subunit K